MELQKRFAIDKSANYNMYDGAMPISYNNVQEFQARMNEYSKSVAASDSRITKATLMFKKPINDMGYDFDATILNTIKMLQNGSWNSPVSQLYFMLGIPMAFIERNNKLVVKESFVKSYLTLSPTP